MIVGYKLDQFSAIWLFFSARIATKYLSWVLGRHCGVQNSAHAHCHAGREGMPREGEREGERQCPPSIRREGERKGHPCTLRTRRVFMRMLYTNAIAVALVDYF